jgi:hypothetical protein
MFGLLLGCMGWLRLPKTGVAPTPAVRYLLQENGDKLLAENGDFLILER